MMRPMRKLALILVALGAPAGADVESGGRVIECYCTDSAGGRVELGQEICLTVDGRAFMALCEMVLNNPAWRDTGRGCVSSRLSVPPQGVTGAGS